MGLCRPSFGPRGRGIGDCYANRLRSAVPRVLQMAGSDAQRLWLQSCKEPAFSSCFLLPLPPPSDPPCLSSNLPGGCDAWPLLEMSGPAPSTLQRETGSTVSCLPLEWVLVKDTEEGGKGTQILRRASSFLGPSCPTFCNWGLATYLTTPT